MIFILVKIHPQIHKKCILAVQKESFDFSPNITVLKYIQEYTQIKLLAPR